MLPYEERRKFHSLRDVGERNECLEKVGVLLHRILVYPLFLSLPDNDQNQSSAPGEARQEVSLSHETVFFVSDAALFRDDCLPSGWLKQEKEARK